MTIGVLDLVPEFDKDTFEYAVTTTSSTNKVTATTTEVGATITLELNGEALTNETSPNWESGENILIITVAGLIGNSVYTVIVTKGE